MASQIVSNQLTTSNKRGGRLLFSTSDENVMLKQIEATHAPDDRVFEVKTFLRIIEDIFNRAVDSQTKLEDRIQPTVFPDMPEHLASTIDIISCEIMCKCRGGGGDAHGTTMAVLNMVSSYSWEGKMVVALAAFAVSYGEFWLVAHFRNSNQLAKSVGFLKQVNLIMEQANVSKHQFDEIRSLMTALIELTKCVIEFKELPSQYITTHIVAGISASTTMAHIPIATYWTIRSVMACASNVANLTASGLEYTPLTRDGWELRPLVGKIRVIHSRLYDQLHGFYESIEKKKQKEIYRTLVFLFGNRQGDNVKGLRVLFNAEDNPQPLVHCPTKRRVNIEMLRGKHVLVLITNLEIPNEELEMLEHIYKEARNHPSGAEYPYEVVWLPIVEDSTTENPFKKLQETMPWYSMHDLSLIGTGVKDFTRDYWKFQKMPILVVIHPQGDVPCLNALHMMWIWGIEAIPFTKEAALWDDQTWKLDFLLLNVIDSTISNWITEGRYICLYGGDNVEWIKQFTETAHKVAEAAGVSLGMVYVGKRYPKGRVWKSIKTITEENLSHHLQDVSLIWYFWVRIESMWQSKLQLRTEIENDTVMQEIKEIMILDSSESGWALISKGSTGEIVKAKGTVFLKCLSQYSEWKQNVEDKGLVVAIKDYLRKIYTSPHDCNALLLPGPGNSSSRIPERVVCPECKRTMERFIIYKCCDE